MKINSLCTWCCLEIKSSHYSYLRSNSSKTLPSNKSIISSEGVKKCISRQVWTSQTNILIIDDQSPLYDAVCKMLQNIVSYLWNALRTTCVKNRSLRVTPSVYFQPQHSFRRKDFQGIFAGFLMAPRRHLTLSSNWPCIYNAQSMVWLPHAAL